MSREHRLRQILLRPLKSHTITQSSDKAIWQTFLQHSYWIYRLNANSATRRRAAALVKFKTSPTTRKYRRCRNSIAEIHYAEKAWQREEHSIGRIARPLVRNS